MPRAGPAVTVTVAKSNVGGWAGDAATHPDLLEAVVPTLDERTETGGLLTDFVVSHVGDDLAVIMSHGRGGRNGEVWAAAEEAFASAGRRARDLKLHGASEAPRVSFAELTFTERPSEPLVVLLTDKAGAGAFNLPLYRAFADPFTTWSLVDDPVLTPGFEFEVLHLASGKRTWFRAPGEAHALLRELGRAETHALTAVRTGRQPAEPAAATTVAGPLDIDPAAVIRAGPGFPALGEILEPWARPTIVPGSGPMAAPGPVLPVGLEDAIATRAAGPPRAVALGFTLANGQLVGPLDLFADRAFDRTRADALHMADFLRRQGPQVLKRE